MYELVDEEGSAEVQTPILAWLLHITHSGYGDMHKTGTTASQSECQHKWGRAMRKTLCYRLQYYTDIFSGVQLIRAKSSVGGLNQDARNIEIIALGIK